VAIRYHDRWLAAAIEKQYKPSPEFTQSAKRPERKLFRAKRSA